MTQDEIIEMAKQAGFKHPNPHDGYMGLAYDRRDGTDTGSSLETFAKLVAAEEREACANLCQSMHKEWVKDELGDIGIAEPSDCAKAIRLRGEA